MPVSCTPRRCAGGGGGSDRGRWPGAPGAPRAPGAGRKGRRGAEGTDPGAARRVSPHTPPFQARAARAALVHRGESLSFPCPVAASLIPGSPGPALGGSARRSLGLAGRGSKAPRSSGCGWVGVRPPVPPLVPPVSPVPTVPGRLGIGRAIPEKVCRAGLGEQRAGGGPGMFVDLFVTQSLLHGVSKAELQALPGRERTWGRGGLGAFLSSPFARRCPSASGSSSGVSLGPRPRATLQELPRNRRDLRPPPPGARLALSGGRAAT